MSKGPTWRDLSPEDTLALWEAYGKLPAPRPVERGDDRDRPECGSGMGYALKGDWIQCVFHQQHPENKRKGRALRLRIGQFYQIKSIEHRVWLNSAGHVRDSASTLIVYRDDGAPALYTTKNFRFIPPAGREPREPAHVHPYNPPYFPSLYTTAPATPIKVAPRIIVFDQVEAGSRKICLD